MVKAMDDEIRVLGYCEECGAQITDECDSIYVDTEGRYFDSVDCVMEFYDITKIEP